MFNKANAHQDSSRRNHTTSSLARHASMPDARKEEFSDWPESLLSIGTFGTNALKEVKQKSFSSNNKNVEQDLPNFTSKEVANLVKELENMGLERGNLTVDQFMDCSTSITDPNYVDYVNDYEIVLSKERELLDDTNSGLKKRSISFLLKRLLVCRGGFAPAPALRDPFSQSRMEKLLKSILGKKIYPHNATATPTKKYLERKHQEKLCIEAAAAEKGDGGSKWVRTDSEYIVLEI